MPNLAAWLLSLDAGSLTGVFDPMRFLRQSTAATVIVGPFVDKTDGVSPKTALASQAGRIVKSGAGTAFTPASWAHDSNGHYLVGVAIGDTDTLGRLRLGWSDPTTYLQVWEDFSVLSAAWYDCLFGAVAPLTDKAGFSLSTAGVQAIWDALTSALATAGSIGKKLADWVLGTDNRALLSANTHTSGATVAAVSGSVGSVTGAVGSVTANVTAGAVLDKTGYALTSAEHTAVQSDVTSGLTTQGYTTGRAAKLDQLDAAVSSRATAALVWSEAIPGSYAAGSAAAKLNSAASAGDPWATVLPGAYAANTAGKLVGTYLDAAVSSRSTYSGGAVASVTGNVGGNVAGSVGSIVGITFPTNFGSMSITVGGALTVGTNNDKTGYALSTAEHAAVQTDVTAGLSTQGYTTTRAGKLDNADVATSTRATVPLVWAEAIPGGYAAGSAAARLNAAGSAGDPWATVLPGAYGSNTAGKLVGMYLDAAVSSRSTYAGGPVASVTGNVGGSVGSIAGVTFPTNFGATAITTGGALTVGTVNDKTGYALTSGEHTAVQGDVGAALTTQGYTTARAPKLDNLDASISSRSTVTAVWTEPIPGSYAAGSAALKLNASASAGDPWTTAIPGSYAPGTAGNIVGNRLDVAISTRSTFAGGAVASVTNPVTVGTNNDKTGYTLSAGEHAQVQSDVDSAMTTQGYTAARALKLDNLDASISSRSTYGGGNVTVGGYAAGQDPATLTQSAAIKAVTDKLGTLIVPGSAPYQFSALALALAPVGGGGIVLAADGLDNVLVENGLNARQALSVIAAGGGGEVSGAVSGQASTITIKGAGVATTRVVASTDSAGNRTSVTLTPPA